MVGQAGATMAQVVRCIDDVGRIIAELTHASAEQSIGLEQINQAIGELDNVTRTPRWSSRPPPPPIRCASSPTA